jgi:hypothetical protein
LDENRLNRCLKSVIRGEWWISALRGGVGFVLVSQGCVPGQTFVEIEEMWVIFFSLLRSILMWRESTHGFVITRTRRRGGGKRGRVVLKVTDSSHLTHGEIVLVTNDDMTHTLCH